MNFLDDASAMAYAIGLAARGIGFVEPNPPVGAVVVNDAGELLGGGWHQRFGEAHAEVNAIAQAGEQCEGATLFVSLEPCCHHGKTPPCTEAIKQAKIKRVVIACPDPFPQVDGDGISTLQAAGIEVSVGLHKEVAARVMAPFLKRQLTGKPYVHAKWAMTLDGKIASKTGHSQWITNESSRARVHELRGRMDAILIGERTARLDNPLLTARPAGPRTATRVVLDSQASLATDSQLAATPDVAPVLLVCADSAASDQVSLLEQTGIEVWSCGKAIDVHTLLLELGRREMTNVFVEGGAGVLGSFFDAGEVDEVHVFVGSKVVGGEDARSAVAGSGAENIPQFAQFDTPNVEIYDGDVYWNAPRKHDWLKRLD